MNRRVLAPLLICIAASLSAASARAENFTGLLTLELEDAILTKPENKEPRYCDLTLDLSGSGTWSKEAWGFGVNFSRAWHPSELTSAKGLIAAPGDELHLVVKMAVDRNIGHDAGDAEYNIDVKRIDGDMVSGTFEGTFCDSKVKGPVLGRIKPLPAKLAGFDGAPPVEGEHPRLLFRKTQIALLREKSKTPEGQAILAQLRAKLMLPANPREKAYHAAAYGLLHILNDSKQDADAAKEICEAALRDDFCTNRYLSSDALIGVALTYDLCWDAWTPEYRAVVASFLADRVSYMVSSNGDSISRIGGSPNGLDYEQNPASEWQAKVRSAVAFASLSILHDRDDAPSPPKPLPVPTLEPASDLDLGRGVPLAKFEHEAVPEKWMYIGPFTPPDKNAWGPSPPKGPLDFLESIGGHQNMRADIGTRVRAFGMTRDFAAVPAKMLSSVKFHLADKTVVDVGTTVGLAAPSVSYFYTVVDNDRARVVKVMTHVWSRVPEMTLWLCGHEVAQGDIVRINPGRLPLLVRVTMEQPQPYFIAPRLHELTEEDAEKDFRGRIWEWGEKEKQREADGHRFESIQESETIAEHALKRFLDTGLFDIPDEGNPQLASALTDSLLPFLSAHRTIKGSDFATGTPGERILDQCLLQTLPNTKVSSASLRPELFTVGLNAAAPASRPLLSGAFERAWGMAGDKSFGIAAPQHAIFALTNLLHPAEATGATAALKTFSDSSNTVHIFRNALKDADDIAATINLSALQGPRAWRETPIPAFFKLFGLGSRWQIREMLERDPPLAKHDHTITPPRKCLSEFRPDGSGFVPSHAQDRDFSFAADYSGASGAPAVFVMASKFRPATQWLLDAGPNCTVSTGDRGFTITAPSGVRLQGRFSAAPLQLRTRGLSNVIEITPPDDFVLVLTLFKGTVPEATFDGAGKDLKINIGPQRISFDSEKIIFAK